MFDAAGISWKKTSKVNPKADAQAVAEKKAEIQRVLARYWEEIEFRRLRVLFEDESHVLSGDLQGYVWGRTDERIEIPIVNERERQTYYGALDLLSKQLLIEAHAKGDTTETMAYLKFLQAQFPGQRLLILWDGASYHRSHELRAFLAEVNAGLPPEEWKIHPLHSVCSE